MQIESARVLPAFHHRRSLVAEDLKRLDDPVVLFECEHIDSDGVAAYIYTVSGTLDGVRLQDGCTVRGEIMLIHAENREEADAIACMGLMDTITALESEEERYIDAEAALARLSTVGATDRIDLAINPERSESFESDMAAVRALAGDDVILAAGRVESAESNAH